MTLSSSRWSPEAVRRLADSRARRYLAPFVARERSVTEAAEELDVSVATMWQQIQRLLEVGLIVETRREPRRGRPIRYYRSTEDAFEVLLEELPQPSLESLLDVGDVRAQVALRDALVDAVLHSRLDPRDLVLRVKRLPNGMVDASPGLRDGRALDLSTVDAWTSWSYLHLSSNDAQELRDELAQLWRRWTHKASAVGASETHILRLATAPVRRRRVP